jgi:hypothetical protein
MKIFRALSKLYNYLTKEESSVDYEESENQIIEEEEILESTIENSYVSDVRDWAVKKIELLHEADRHRNAKALLAEFDEWINIPEGTEELDYLCLEDNEWTDEQEVDVRRPNP